MLLRRLVKRKGKDKVNVQFRVTIEGASGLPEQLNNKSISVSWRAGSKKHNRRGNTGGAICRQGRAEWHTVSTLYLNLWQDPSTKIFDDKQMIFNLVHELDELKPSSFSSSVQPRKRKGRLLATASVEIAKLAVHKTTTTFALTLPLSAKKFASSDCAAELTITVTSEWIQFNNMLLKPIFNGTLTSPLPAPFSGHISFSAPGICTISCSSSNEPSQFEPLESAPASTIEINGVRYALEPPANQPVGSDNLSTFSDNDHTSDIDSNESFDVADDRSVDDDISFINDDDIRSSSSSSPPVTMATKLAVRPRRSASMGNLLSVCSPNRSARRSLSMEASSPLANSDNATVEFQHASEWEREIEQLRGKIEEISGARETLREQLCITEREMKRRESEHTRREAELVTMVTALTESKNELERLLSEAKAAQFTAERSVAVAAEQMRAISEQLEDERRQHGVQQEAAANHIARLKAEVHAQGELLKHERNSEKLLQNLNEERNRRDRAEKHTELCEMRIGELERQLSEIGQLKQQIEAALTHERRVVERLSEKLASAKSELQCTQALLQQERIARHTEQEQYQSHLRTCKHAVSTVVDACCGSDSGIASVNAAVQVDTNLMENEHSLHEKEAGEEDAKNREEQLVQRIGELQGMITQLELECVMHRQALEEAQCEFGRQKAAMHNEVCRQQAALQEAIVFAESRARTLAGELEGALAQLARSSTRHTEHSVQTDPLPDYNSVLDHCQSHIARLSKEVVDTEQRMAALTKANEALHSKLAAVEQRERQATERASGFLQRISFLEQHIIELTDECRRQRQLIAQHLTELEYERSLRQQEQARIDMETLNMRERVDSSCQTDNAHTTGLLNIEALDEQQVGTWGCNCDDYHADSTSLRTDNSTQYALQSMRPNMHCNGLEMHKTVLESVEKTCRRIEIETSNNARLISQMTDEHRQMAVRGVHIQASRYQEPLLAANNPPLEGNVAHCVMQSQYIHNNTQEQHKEEKPIRDSTLPSERSSSIGGWLIVGLWGVIVAASIVAWKRS